MIYLYDEAIVNDLKRSFNPNNVPNPAVKVIDPEGAIDLAAQMAEDLVEYPVVALTRGDDTPIDTKRTNFTLMHMGTACVFNKETNEYYNEQVLPIELNYAMTLLTTNTADMDELIRELLFKYTSMYFLSITIPYESKRVVRFGISIDHDQGISRDSSTYDYLKSGQLHQSIIHLKCEGCVLVNYTPHKLRRQVHEIEAKGPVQ